MWLSSGFQAEKQENDNHYNFGCCLHVVKFRREFFLLWLKNNLNGTQGVGLFRKSYPSVGTSTPPGAV